MDAVEVILVGFLILIIAMALACLFVVPAVQCNRLGELNSDIETEWGFLTGCFVKTPSGRWIAAEQWQIVNAQVEYVE